MACASAALCLVPTASVARTAGDACEGKLTGAGQQAELSFSCNFSVIGIEIFSNKDATINGDIKGEREGPRGAEGFVCPQPVLKGPPGQQGGDTFGQAPAICEGGLSAGNTATGTLIARDDVCDPLALRVGAFSLGAPEDEFIVRIQGCERDDDDDGGRRDEDGGTRPDEDGGIRPDEDGGRIPRGGVDSGGGATAPADGTGTDLLAAAGLILAAALGLGTARGARAARRRYSAVSGGSFGGGLRPYSGAVRIRGGNRQRQLRGRPT